jgi:hypothetical protein
MLHIETIVVIVYANQAKKYHTREGQAEMIYRFRHKGTGVIVTINAAYIGMVRFYRKSNEYEELPGQYRA